MLDILNKVLDYFWIYYKNIGLSLLYFMALSLVGVFLIWKRGSLIGLVVTQSSRLLFVIALHLLVYLKILDLDSNIMIDMQKYDLLFLIFNFIFISLLIYLFVILEKKQGIVNNKESIFAIVFIALLSIEPLIYKILNINIEYLNTIYFSEILYSSPMVLIHYLKYILVFIILLLFYLNPIFISIFDNFRARIMGIHTLFYNFIFYVIVMGVLSISIRVMTSHLAMAMLLVPSYLAVYLARSRMQSFLLAILFACFFGIVGFFVSFILDTLPTEYVIVVVSIFLFFIIYFMFKRK